MTPIDDYIMTLTELRTAVPKRLADLLPSDQKVIMRSLGDAIFRLRIAQHKLAEQQAAAQAALEIIQGR